MKMNRIATALLIVAVALVGVVPVAAAAQPDTATINVNNKSSYEYSFVFLHGSTLVEAASAHASGWVTMSGPAGLYEYFLRREDGFTFHGYVNIAAGSTVEFTLSPGPSADPVLSIQSAPPPPPPPPTSYTVQRGDKLVDIATTMGTTVEYLTTVNRLENANLLRVDQVLYTNRYVVQGGETLSQIARKLGVSLGSLADANGLSSPYTIYGGQMLSVPRP